MMIWSILGEISFGFLILFFLLFAVYSLIEAERRAFWRSSLIFLILLINNVILLFIGEPWRSWLFGGVFVLFVLFILLLVFYPLKRQTVDIVGTQKKIDERDVIFARFDYQEGSEIFNEYYNKRPEFKAIDQKIRKLPDILSPAHLKKNPWLFSLAAAEFHFLEHQVTRVSGQPKTDKLESSSFENTRRIKAIIDYLGSDVCGICALDQAYVYSHVGRGPEPSGQEIKNDHTYAIVFALEMDLGMVHSAPEVPVVVETGKKYVEGARISIIVADLIRRLGYSAQAHIAGSNYQAILPPLGWNAGIGELGRLGILITHKYGPRARLGLVTTDLPLDPDRPWASGIQDFCQKCQKCARNCPSQAIPRGDKVEENGVLKWTLNREECYRYWRKVGTDCALCIYVCPYSKADNLIHNLIRKMIERSAFGQTLSVWGDDLFYGRIPLRHKSPLDF